MSDSGILPTQCRLRESSPRSISGRSHQTVRSYGSPTLRRVPVSRNRKKKPGKYGRPRQSTRVGQRGSAADLSEHDHRELAEAWQGLTAYHEQVHAGRRTRAAAAATDLVTGLVTVVANQPDVIVETRCAYDWERC